MNSQQRQKRKTLENRLRKEITPIKSSKDGEQNILHYCQLGWHYGVIGEEKAQGCIERGCKHYKVYREE